MSEASGILSKSAFSKQQGWRPSYVTKLAQAGRLVMTDDGKVDVAASLARLEATRDPRYDVQRDRHAKKRDERRIAEQASAPLPTVAAVASDESEAEADDEGEEGEAFDPPATPEAKAAAESDAAAERRARTTKMHYEARKAKIRVAKLQGLLIGVERVKQMGSNDGATLRSMFENLADQGAPRLAPVRDPDAVARILRELFGDITSKLESLGVKNRELMRQAAAESH